MGGGGELPRSGSTEYRKGSALTGEKKRKYCYAGGTTEVKTPNPDEEEGV